MTLFGQALSLFQQPNKGNFTNLCAVGVIEFSHAKACISYDPKVP